DAARDTITLLLTHQHSDHVIGLAHFAPLVARSHHVRIACGGVPAATLRTLVDQQLSAPLFPTLDGLPEAVRVEAFDRDGVCVLDDTHRVVALPAHHPGGAAVLRVDDAHGALLAYAPDNELAMSRDEASISAWRASLCDALRGIPVLIHDATYVDDELAAHRGWGHSSAEEATRFAMACEAGTLLLTHHHPARSDDEIDAIVSRCRAIAAEAGSSLQVAAASERTPLVV
ncbi:MAG: hypothetical protein IT353_09525, partial [Gemmatimonadaceae bacterium]|nr:hypothetical protein [Gemmatimonadaceae bacterium]